MKFEFLEHTADAKFKAYGENIEEAFINSAYAMNYILSGEIVIKPLISKQISIKSSSKINLLHDFLSEFLYLIDTESIILSQIKNLKIENWSEENNDLSLSCDAYFDKISNYELSGDIKSITYSEIEIIEKPKSVSIQVVVDI